MATLRRVIAYVILVVVSACGVPIDSEPDQIDLELDGRPEIERPTLEDLESVSIYLVRNDSLVHATRDLPIPATPDAILASLLDGVTDPEERASLRTSIPPGTQILGIGRDGAVLRLNLSREFTAVGGEEEIHAVAQIVLTATSIDGVDFVTFEIEGVPTDVPVTDGALSVEPVGPGDYEELVSA